MKARFPLISFLPLVAATAVIAEEPTPAQTFATHCAACHLLDQMVVGPSLVEIAGIYRDDPDGFVAWSAEPEAKREGMIRMPSMAHLGESTLRDLHAYVLSAAEGQTEVPKAEGDPYAVPPELARRPQVQRIFLPDASPAAIAVALPGDLSYAFDAAECRLRYVWQGGFINASGHWKGNGSQLARPAGDVVYREPGFPVSATSASADPSPKFLGYRIGSDGLPTFRYRRHGLTWSETIRPLPDGGGIERHFETDSPTPLVVTAPEGIAVESGTGDLRLPADQARSFTLTFRWK